MSESTERIYALLVDANPVPHINELPVTLAETPHLYVIDSRRDDMQTETPQRVQPVPPPPRRRRVWIPALVGAAAVLAAVVVAVFAFRGDTTPEPAPPATQPPVVTTVAVDPAQAKIDLAQQVIADFNSGDLEAFRGHFAEDAAINEQWSVTEPGWPLEMGFFTALGQQAVVTECRPFGAGFTHCITVASDALSGPAGIETDMTWQFRIAGDEVTSLDYLFPPTEGPDSFTVIEDMVAWIQSNHSDVFESTFRATLDRCDATNFNFYGTWCSSPAAAEEMLRLAPEFLAQADL